jgi:hypothetical protein
MSIPYLALLRALDNTPMDRIGNDRCLGESASPSLSAPLWLLRPLSMNGAAPFRLVVNILRRFLTTNGLFALLRVVQQCTTNDKHWSVNKQNVCLRTSDLIHEKETTSSRCLIAGITS